MLRHPFLKPDTVGLIPKGGYSGNIIYSKKQLCGGFTNRRTIAKFCTTEMGENTDCLNCPVLVWMAIAQNKKVYEFYGCYFHGHTCIPYRDTATLGRDNDTLAQRYEQTMTRLEQITKPDY
jgi:hypothetical protein